MSKSLNKHNDKWQHAFKNAYSHMFGRALRFPSPLVVGFYFLQPSSADLHRCHASQFPGFWSWTGAVSLILLVHHPGLNNFCIFQFSLTQIITVDFSASHSVTLLKKSSWISVCIFYLCCSSGVLKQICQHTNSNSMTLWNTEICKDSKMINGFQKWLELEGEGYLASKGYLGW